MTDHEPGPELDRLVAEAIGLKYVLYGGEDVYAVRKDPDAYQPHLPVGDYFPRTEVGWTPSTDWNDAMESAERAGLFDPPHEACVHKGGPQGEWVCGMAGDVEVMATTGPLAISLAVLKLKEQP